MAVDIVSLSFKVDSRDIKKGRVELTALEGAAVKTEKAAKKMELSFKLAAKATAAMTIAFAAFKAKQIATDAALMAARYETLGVSLDVVGKNAGYVSSELDAVTKSLRDSGISMISARSATIKMIQAHIDLSDATKLSRIAQDAAVIGNINSSESFERLVYGIQTAQIEVLKTIGLTVNFENSYKKLAKQLGKTQSELTESEKTQARLNIVMERGQDIAGTYEAAMTTASKKINSFSRYVDDFKVKMGKAFGPAISQLIDDATKAMKNFTLTISDPVIQSGLRNIAKSMGIIISGVMKLTTFLAKYAGLRSVTATFFEGMELAKKGIIDQDKFIKASFIERQKMIDKHKETFGKFTGIINEQTEGYKAYKLSIAKAAKESKKENEEAIKEADRLRKIAEADKKFFKDLKTNVIAEVDKAFVDLWSNTADGFEDFGDALLDSFTNMLAEMAHRATTQQIMFNMGFGGAPITAGAATAGYTAAGALIGAGIIKHELDRQGKKDDKRFAKLSADFLQGIQLTGTILGDIHTQSESTVNALDEILRVDIAGLEISREMLNALAKTATANERLSAKIGRAPGGLTSAIGGAPKTYGLSERGESILGVALTGTPFIQSLMQPFGLPILSAFGSFALDIGNKAASVISKALGSTKKRVINTGIYVIGQNLSDILEEGFKGLTFVDIKKTTRRLWKKKSKLITEYGVIPKGVVDSITEMFFGLSDALTYGSNILGISIDRIINRLIIPSQKISLMGKSAEEAGKIVGNFVSMTADKWAATILNGTDLLEDFQQAGEGAFQTFSRIVNEMEWFESSLKSIGVTIFETGIDFARSTQEIIEIAGSIDSLGESMTNFYNSFFTDEEKHLNNTRSLRESFSEMEMILPANREGFKNLIQSLDLTNKANKERFVNLINLSNVADKYYSRLEQISKTEHDIFLDKLNDTFSNITSVLEDALRNVEALDQAQKDISDELAGGEYSRSRSNLMAALESARRGDLSLISGAVASISGITGGPTGAATEIEYKREQLQNIAAIAELKNLAGGQIATDEKIIETLKAQLEGADALKEFSIENGGEQLNALMQIDFSINTVVDAISILANIASTTGEDSSTALQELNNRLAQRKEFEAAIPGQMITFEEEKISKLAQTKISYEKMVSLYESEIDSLVEKRKSLIEKISPYLIGEPIEISELSEWRETQKIKKWLDVERPYLTKIESKRTELETLSDRYNIDINRINALYDLQVSNLETALNAAVINESDILSGIQSQELLSRQYEAILNMLNIEIPKYANGGYHSGGLAIVGETGPELVNMQPSKIINNSDTKNLLSNEDLINEIRELRQAIISGNYAIAKNTMDTKDILEKWDIDGSPEERQVA